MFERGQFSTTNITYINVTKLDSRQNAHHYLIHYRGTRTTNWSNLGNIDSTMTVEIFRYNS